MSMILANLYHKQICISLNRSFPWYPEEISQTCYRYFYCYCFYAISFKGCSYNQWSVQLFSTGPWNSCTELVWWQSLPLMWLWITAFWDNSSGYRYPCCSTQTIQWLICQLPIAIFFSMCIVLIGQEWRLTAWSHYLNQQWFIWTLTNEIQWNLIQSDIIFIQANTLEISH